MAVKNSFNNFIQFITALIKTAIKSALSLRTTFIMQVLAMIINDLLWIFMWWILFKQQPIINSWNFDDVILMQGILLASYALFSTFMYGLDDLPRYINNGSLDNFLTIPKNILLILTCSKVKPSGIGDLVTAGIMFMFTSYATWNNLHLIIVGITCGTTIFFAFRLITATLTFWSANIEHLGLHIFYSLLTFASQPASIFTGWYQVLILTIIPAGFISLLPVEIIKHFVVTKLILLISGSIMLLIFSLWLFYRGLQSYTSGNQFNIMD